MTGNGIRRLAMAALALMLTALVFGWSGAGSTQKAEAVVDPVAVLQQFIDKLNAGDAAGAAAMFTEDGWLADVDGGSFQASGRPALAFIFDTPGIHVTLLPGSTMTSTVSGTQVDGKIEYTDDDVQAAGFSRYIQPFVAQVTDDGLISSLYNTYDASDPETAEWLAYQDAQTDDGENPPGTIEVAIGGDQPGSAFLAPLAEGVLGVFIVIAPGPAGMEQAAHIHAGSCGSNGEVVYPLASVIDGESFSIISADLDALLAGDYYINVHNHETGADAACGDVEAVVALPSTGDGGASGSDSPALLLALLGMVGLAFVTGGLVRARRV